MFQTYFHKLHKWLGLISGLFVFFLSFTGSLYVFQDPIEDYFNREIVFVKAQDKKVPVDSILHRFQQEYEKPLNQVFIFPSPKRAYMLEVIYQSGLRTKFYANPYTGEILGERSFKIASIFSLILKAHRSFLLPKGGVILSGLMTGIFCLSLITGLVINWNRGARIEKASRKFSKKIIRFHSRVGFLGSIFLLIMGLSGVYLAFTGVQNFAFNLLDGSGPHFKDPSLVMKVPASEDRYSYMHLSVDVCLEEAEKAFPYHSSSLRMVRLAKDTEHPLIITGFNRNNPLGLSVRERAYFSDKGILYHKEDASSLTSGQSLHAVISQIHTGAMYGWPSMIFYFILSLLGMLIPLSGILLFFSKPKKSTPYS